jgi:hypothetical protein
LFFLQKSPEIPGLILPIYYRRFFINHDEIVVLHVIGGGSPAYCLQDLMQDLPGGRVIRGQKKRYRVAAPI